MKNTTLGASQDAGKGARPTQKTDSTRTVPLKKSGSLKEQDYAAD